MASPTTNVVTHLADIAMREPDRPALHATKWLSFAERSSVAIDSLTFAELLSLSGQIARGLEEVGVRRGVRTVLMVRPSLDFFALTFALFRVGAVPVLVDPGMGLGNLGKCLAEARPEAFIGIPKAHVARRILRWSRRTIRTTVTTGPRIFGGRHTLSQLREIGQRQGVLPIADTKADETAAILFTSGSTGIAKGAVYTHGIFAAQVEYLRTVYGIESGEVDLCTFPLFALFAPALGMTAVIPDMDATRPGRVDPRMVIKSVEHFGVTNLFGSPALIDRVGSYGHEHGVKLPTLRRVISAGAPVSAKIIERLTTMLGPGVQLFTPYGATEALPVANIGSDVILNETRQLADTGRGICVGRPVPNMDVRIIPICDAPMPTFDPGTCLPSPAVGEIAVCGPVVTPEYFGRPEATALAKMRDADGRIWHRMGDVGYFDNQGRLWFCGRKSHRVEAPAQTLFTDQVEPIFNTVAGVRRTALVGVKREGVVRPVLCVELEDTCRRPWHEIDSALRARAAEFEHLRDIDVFLEYPRDFPVDPRHNSKIFREKLAHWVDTEMRWVRIPRGAPT